LSEPKFDPAAAQYCKIHPGIGIARLGNSQQDYFIGPEVPGISVQPEVELFKDKEGKIKRQAVLFRVYAYDSDDKVMKELTSADCTITWHVHLANKKGENKLFVGRFRHTDEIRNSKISNRNDLIIDPGSHSISGTNEAGDKYKFDTGKFLNVTVPLGELRTDDKGRLIVLGGFGKSDSIDMEKYPIRQYANNDGWFDDTSDGPVTASVTLRNGKNLPLKSSAWVIIAPPKFAPYHYPLVTLYDTMTQVALNQKWLTKPTEVSFMRDIYPIFYRVIQYSWLNTMAEGGHGPGTILREFKHLSDNSQNNSNLRKMIFNRIRNPSLINNPSSAEAIKQAEAFYMPPMSGDDGESDQGKIQTWMTILPFQYDNLKRWSEGDFISDWNEASQLAPISKIEQIPIDEQPSSLEKAALDLAIGAPFFPGIEITYIVWDPSLYDGQAFRINPDLEAGDITKHMALPWQADFLLCSNDWWPTARPDDVIPEDHHFVDKAATSKKWARDQDGKEFGDYIDMVNKWSKLGFVKPVNINGKTFFLETERNL